VEMDRLGKKKGGWIVTFEGGLSCGTHRQGWIRYDMKGGNVCLLGCFKSVWGGKELSLKRCNRGLLHNLRDDTYGPKNYRTLRTNPVTVGGRGGGDSF